MDFVESPRWYVMHTTWFLSLSHVGTFPPARIAAVLIQRSTQCYPRLPKVAHVLLTEEPGDAHHIHDIQLMAIMWVRFKIRPRAVARHYGVSPASH